MYIISYNGYTIQNDNQTVITKLDGLTRIPVRIAEDALTGADGGNIWQRRYDQRPITIEGSILATTLSNYYLVWDQITTAFNIYSPLTVLTITRPDGVSKSINAKVVDVPQFNESIGDWAVADFQITLKASDPYFIDVSPTIGTTGLAVGGGFPIPAPVGTPLLGAFNNTISMSNIGDVSAYPSFTISNACVNPSVTNTTTGESFVLNGLTLTDGQSVTIYRNTTGFFVLNQSGVSYMSYFVGTLPKMVAGVNVFRFTASTYSATASLSISFYNKYMNI